jgi:hypothetical protein
MAREPDNHIDHPRMFRFWRCAVCQRCNVHVETGRCVHAGPFVGYVTANPAAPHRGYIYQHEGET